MKFKDLINETGFLTEAGKKEVEDFKLSIFGFINAINFNNLSESQLSIIGSVLSKELGDTISLLIQEKLDDENSFSKMDDQEFKQYLETKYGSNWILRSLTPAELNRVPLPSEQERAEVMEKARKDREACENEMSRLCVSHLIIR
jgi:hypothetical protein